MADQFGINACICSWAQSALAELHLGQGGCNNSVHSTEISSSLKFSAKLPDQLLPLRHTLRSSVPASQRMACRLLDQLPDDFRAVFTEDAAATGAEAVRAGLADGSGQRGVQADLVLAAFAPLLRDRLLAWTMPVSRGITPVLSHSIDAPPEVTVTDFMLAAFAQLHYEDPCPLLVLTPCLCIFQDGEWTGDGGQRTKPSARLRFAAHLVLALRALRDAPDASEELQTLDDLQVTLALESDDERQSR